jgi:hypothetical protein
VAFGCPFFLQKNKILRYTNMKILTTSSQSQDVKFIPRKTVVGNIDFKLRDETLNSSTTYNVPFTVSSDYYVASLTLSLLEGRFYELTVLSGSEIIYRDKIFCTDQEINQSINDYYTINQGVYITENSRNNQYITL